MKSIRKEPSKGSFDLPRRLRRAKPGFVNAFWMLCVLSVGLALSASCGPEQEFCPNTGSMMGGKCPIMGDDGGPRVFDSGTGASTGNLCPPGQHGVAVGDAVVCM